MTRVGICSSRFFLTKKSSKYSASGNSIYSKANGSLQLEALVCSNKGPILPKEMVFPPTRYNLGFSAMKGVVPRNVLQRLFYLTRIQIALLHNSPAEAL
ncbi:PREDICTED: LOW QUALITY PROTEIN: BH3-like motif-containing cell death inducer [Galeopterus variegatus]|uniref:LOW QUALITY PROTEIN: BH3-like motif-containing cell death inducer n=1 Tax=Galeopterus variegatus TaxID=482537 RepID=A0ABM0R5C0_GALVR|nr:PREDICTED: LOW QUALITY PROTEIN: BH3-like motif-containing cell death inducer [Galeopterus variegatus]